MARRVFFSFHFARDSWRVAQVRNSWVIAGRREASPFLDKADWEAIKRRGKEAVRHWIDEQMRGTSVTVVLIGRETASREWVQYEIQRSHEDGKGMLGIYIHRLLDQNRQTDPQGPNPFDQFYAQSATGRIRLSQIYPVYDWILQDGRNNMPSWIEAAAKAAGR
jgi:hypothetical protein